jgi:two-component system response regulator LytT
MEANKGYHILIVEDELLIAEHISTILHAAGYINTTIAMSVDKALQAINNKKPSMVLTDIALGHIQTGIDLGALLYEQFKIPFIYITSHSSTEMFSKAKHTRPNAYLVKPFKKEDLLVAIELALFNSELNNKITENNSLLIKDGHAMARIPHNEIMWLEAEGNYTLIYTSGNKKRLIRNVITELQQQLPTNDFLRIHKSYAVNKKYVTELQAAQIVLGDIKLPVGRTYRELLIEQLK